MTARSSKASKPSREERRENALRPSAFLGYDRDRLATYLFERGAYALAESQLRRAVWLNPFEPAFKVHLAWCLYRQGSLAEAHDWAMEALAQEDEPHAREILDLAALELEIPRQP